MPHVIQQPTVIHQHLKTQTVAGEVTINLNLTITINQDGTVQIAAAPKDEQQVPDSLYVIPEFDSNEMLSNFGK